MMIKKKKIIVFCFIEAMLGLSGCRKEIKISKTDALDIAYDYSGLSEEEVLNPTIQEEQDGYLVCLGTAKGTYEYLVNLKGIVQSRNFAAKSSSENVISSPQPTVSPQPASEVASESDLSQVSSSSSINAATNSEDISEWTPEEAQVIDLALRHVGAAEENISNLTVQSESEYLVVRFNYGSSVNIVTVDPVTFQVISTRFE